MKPYLIFISIILFGSCMQSDTASKEMTKKNNRENKITDYLPRTIPDDSLKHYLYEVDKTEDLIHTKNFKSLAEFPSKWIKLSNSKAGHIIYHCGDEIASSINIDSDILEIKGIMENILWEIREFKKLEGENYVFQLSADSVNSFVAEHKFAIVDKDTLLTICSTTVYKSDNGGNKTLMDKYEGLYVPIQHQYMFKHIDEPNKISPDSWINFDSFDFEKLKLRR